MVCEGLFNLFGTSSTEVIARAKEESKQEIGKLSSSNKQLSSQIDYLKNLLKQNNIAFDLSAVSSETDILNH